MAVSFGRPRYTALEPYKHVIWSWYILQNNTVSHTRILLQSTYPELLTFTGTSQNADGINYFPSMRTLENALHRWGYFKRNPQQAIYDKGNDLVQQRLWVLFYQYGLNDQEILGFLNWDEYNISLSRLVL